MTGGRGGGPYSPVIEIDDDSHSRFITGVAVRTFKTTSVLKRPFSDLFSFQGSYGETGVSQGPGGRGGNRFFDDGSEDSEMKREMYCQPRNSLLSLTADFMAKSSAKMAELNKRGGQEKPVELLDSKCFMKLVDVANSLLKMAPYDLDCVKLNGLQKYMHQVRGLFVSFLRFNLQRSSFSGLPFDRLVFGGDEALFDRPHAPRRQALPQDPKVRQGLSLGGLEGRSEPAEGRLPHSMASSVHR